MSTPVSRRSFLHGLGASLALGALPEIARGADGRPPNIVFILIDDLGWRDVGCNGSTFYETPNVDRLASSGMRFTDGYAACTVCSPTRASIMTGKYPARLHLTDWISGHRRPYAKLRIPEWTKFLPSEETSLAEALKPRGYATGFIGKWHLGDREEYWPLKQGFDVNIGGYSRGQPPSYFAPYRIPTMTEGPKGEYLTDRHAADAEAFLEANREKPFLLYLSMYAVHTPLQAKKELIAKYEAKIKAAPEKAQGKAVYAAMIESMDQCVGRVLDTLDRLELSDHTVVFFTGDNGGLVGNPRSPITDNSPLRAGKGSSYEGGVREPFVVRWPGVTRPGSRCAEPVISVDAYPTILEIAGAKGDPAHNRGVDGTSMVPLLRGKPSLAREAIYWHYPHYHPGGASPYGAIRKGDHKLIEFYEDGRRELYNLRADIGETTDLAATQPELAKELHGKLVAWRQAVGAQMPTANPDHDPERDGRGGRKRPPKRKDLPSDEFAILRGAKATPTDGGWRLEGKGEGTALTELPTPITGRAVFEVEAQTLLAREDGWQNAFLALSGTGRDRDLVVAGLYIGGLRMAIWQGLSTAKVGEVVASASFDRQQKLKIVVEVDVPGRRLSLRAAGKTLTRELPKNLTAIRFAGYHIMQTQTVFGKVKISTK
ncbi:MAG: sulfatase [Victivallales bacterium]|nr:sulfatase [Victivallales bacterium]